MDFDQLRTFLLVAQGGGLLHASSRLRLTPAAVSLRLKRLEDEIGVQLFHRRPNKLLLTEKGGLFLNRVQQILDDLRNGVELLREGDEIRSGTLAVALASDMAFFFAPYISLFAKENPMMRLSVLGRSTTDTLELVSNDQVDIGVGWFNSLPPRLEKIHLLSSGLVAIYPKSATSLSSRKLSIKTLSEQGLILLTSHSPTRKAIDHVFFHNGLPLNPVIEASSCFAIKQYVKLGLGIGLVHDICFLTEKEPALRMTNFRQLFGQWEVALIHKKTRTPPLAHRRFIETLSRATELSALRRLSQQTEPKL